MAGFALKPSISLRAGASESELLDSESGTSLTLSAQEAAVLALADGSRSPAQISAEATRRGVPIDAEAASKLLEQFWEQGVLEVRVPTDKPRARRAAPAAASAAAPPPLGPADVVPKLRPDLRVTRRADKGQALFEVENPADGRKFTLYDFELSIARMLTGERRASEVVENAKRLGIPATLESLQKFVRQLQLYGFLDDGAPPAPAATAPPEDADGATFSPRKKWEPAQRELFQGAIRLLRQGRPKTAKNYLEALLQMDPDNSEAIELLALAQSQLGGSESLRDEEDDDDAQASGSEEADGSDEDGAEEEEEAPASQSVEEAVADPEEQLAAARRRRVRRFALLGAAALGVASTAVVPVSLNITAECQLVPFERATVRAKMDGFVREVLVAEGDWVEKGQPLAELSTGEIRKRLERREAEVAQAESELALAKKGARPEELARLQAVLKGKQRALGIAQAELTRVNRLVAKKLAPAEEALTARQKVASLSAEAAESAAELRLAEAGSRSEELAKREAELKARRIDLDMVRAELEAAVLTAPIAGVITTPGLRDKLNSRLSEGAVFCDVEHTRSMRVVAKVPERELDAVALDQAVSIKVANLPTEVFKGKVTFLSPAIEEDPSSGSRSFRVESLLENPNGTLKPNQSGYVKIHSGRRTVLGLLTRHLVRWLRLRFLL